MQTTALPRISSIDILRALTMVLMIFVNDLWSLKEIPLWLGHTAANEDGMGLADVVFPAFLVIVGMSVPFAVGSRRSKGQSKKEIALHIILRSFALIIMGVFLVNGESINTAVMGIPRWLWFPLCCLCFILIWNKYPKTINTKLRLALQFTGWMILISLSFLYRGGDDGTKHFATSWWGILGLIGWAYLVSALIFTYSGNRIINVLLFFALCLGLNVATHARLLPVAPFLNKMISPFGEGAMPAFVTAGVLSSMLFINFRNKVNKYNYIWLLAILSVFLLIAGFSLRFLNGISKIKATPSWVLICTAITFAAFAIIYWLADIHKKDYWFNVIKPAGTNTLTCYLLPYFVYALIHAFSLSYPEAISVGIFGLIKSAVFALLIVLLGGWLGKRGVQVKL